MREKRMGGEAGEPHPAKNYDSQKSPEPCQTPFLSSWEPTWRR